MNYKNVHCSQQVEKSFSDSSNPQPNNSGFVLLSCKGETAVSFFVLFWFSLTSKVCGAEDKVAPKLRAVHQQRSTCVRMVSPLLHKRRAAHPLQTHPAPPAQLSQAANTQRICPSLRRQVQVSTAMTEQRRRADLEIPLHEGSRQQARKT